MKLAGLGEFGLIEHIRKQVAEAANVCRGIGDDAAELCLPPNHHLLTSTDLLIEHIHFRLDWTDAQSLGRKAVAVNLSDLAAMGGTPLFLYLGLACPIHADVAFVDAFLAGAMLEMKEHQVTLVGGDTCQSPGPWIISVTVEGIVSQGKSVGRDGARPGELVLVSGTLGDSALALQLLKENRPLQPYLKERHLCPKARVMLGQALGAKQLATAMIDISDGLSSDLQHILRASKVDAILEQAELPLSPPFQEVLKERPDRYNLALHGGEDYELLFTVKAKELTKVMTLANKLDVPVTVIGSIVEGSGRLYLKDMDGMVQPIKAKGYDHVPQEAFGREIRD